MCAASDHPLITFRTGHPVIDQLLDDMIFIEGGTFQMGYKSGEYYDVDMSQFPIHQVTLDSFFAGKTLVTQAQWEAVMGSNPSFFTGNPNHPVEQVSWEDCQEFISKLNALTGLRFALPTESQWEFAAFGGNRSEGYHFAGSNDMNEVGWHWWISGGTTHPVASKKPNELGLYDMSGNVMEWCADWFGRYPSRKVKNPVGIQNGRSRIIRGGSYKHAAWYARNPQRNYWYVNGRGSFVGFRLFCALPSQTFVAAPPALINGKRLKLRKINQPT
ncbi:MAG: formylglycine-generating enzyme family protein [Bacteroidales bacterium]